ncbi:hypothetical protein HZA96_04385 [Candidatus Woesearchaeota archaeon]|nr:hypothetical protein [Candidatus Woesearchaeota archaeon]
MIRCKTKQWGSSIGIVLPKKIVHQHNLKPHEDIVIEIKGKSANVLKELFGSMKFSKPTQRLLKEAREELESKR